MATPTAQSGSQIIKDALVALNVIREDETPTAEQQALCIRCLNQMMAMWEADGKALGYIPIGTATDTLMVPDGAIMGIYTSLAILIAPSYGAQISQELLESYNRGMAVIDKITAKQVIMNMDVQSSSADDRDFNINYG